jgi:hypothetical protein
MLSSMVKYESNSLNMGRDTLGSLIDYMAPFSIYLFFSSSSFYLALDRFFSMLSKYWKVCKYVGFLIFLLHGDSLFKIDSFDNDKFKYADLSSLTLFLLSTCLSICCMLSSLSRGDITPLIITDYLLSLYFTDRNLGECWLSKVRIGSTAQCKQK